MDTKEVYDVGELPELGQVPKFMHAWTIREERLGEPETAFAEEIVPVPEIRDDEVLVATCSAGINYNGIWAAKGYPKNVIESNGDYTDKKEDFHICGSEAAGIVYKVGKDVKNVKVGQKICMGGAQYDRDCPYIMAGGDPCLSPTYRIWGYEGNWGAFAQFSRVKETQCVPLPDFLTMDEGVTLLSTGVTVYRMLTHWKGNEIKPGDVVLIWGGAGGLGINAILLVKSMGGIPVAVVSSDEKGELCVKLGAKGYINRKKYHHWGLIDCSNQKEYKQWLISALRFRNELWNIIGSRKSPDIVIEHPGGDTLPTSLFVCSSGGMVVLCGATSNYQANIDLRYLWLSQKRIQGSHAGNLKDFEGFMEKVEQYKIRPYISKVYDWDGVGQAHADLRDGKIVGKAIVHICNPNTNE